MIKIKMYNTDQIKNKKSANKNANFEKESFLFSDMGQHLKCMIKMWDECLTKRDAVLRGLETSELETQVAFTIIDRCISRWEVYQMMFKQFYNVDYHFTRTDEYFGICTEDETDWLYKFYKL